MNPILSSSHGRVSQRGVPTLSGHPRSASAGSARRRNRWCRVTVAVVVGLAAGAWLAACDPEEAGITKGDVGLEPATLRFCCDPDAPFPQTIGTFQFTNHSPHAVEVVQLEKDVYGDSYPYHVGSWSQGSSTETTQVAIASACQGNGSFGTIQLAVRFDDTNGDAPETVVPMIDVYEDCSVGPDGGVDGGDGGTDAGGPTTCAQDVGTLDFALDPTLLQADVQALATGNTTHGSDDVATCVSGSWTDHKCGGGRVVADTALYHANLSAGAHEGYHVYGIGGAQSDGTTDPQGEGDGDHLVLVMVVDDPVPADADGLHVQYAFVFDVDGAASNDFQPLPAYPADFFGGTDTWVELLHEPNSGWRAVVSDVVNNAPVPRATSAARVVIAGNVVMLVVPVTDLFGSSSYPNATYRFSAFRHNGGYLGDPNWNGDVSPPVAEPMLPVPQP